MGGPPAPSLFESAAGKIEEAFRRMIDAKELDTLGYPGIPTRAECEQAAKAIEGGIIQAKARWVCVRSREILQPTPRIEK